jgi:hypothetical protein
MTLGQLSLVALLIGSVGLAGCAAPEPGTAEPQRQAEASPSGTGSGVSLTATAIPAGYSSVGELAGRGEFFAARGQASTRPHDGSHYHGYDGPLVWAAEGDGTRTQGLLYGVEDDVIVSAGYLIPQADLAAGRSFHGMTLREVDLPVARSMTVDLIPGETPGSGRYLFLWHFRPPSGASAPTPEVGDLPSLASLGDAFTVVACDHIPDTRFCPGMGRHYTDLSVPTGGPAFARQPEDTDTAGVIFGEAAGKLIFIEYVFGQADLIEGMSWPAIPLDGLPIPPVDNVHVLHFGTDESTSGRYTVHMYFLPEEVYLGWEAEPSAL